MKNNLGMIFCIFILMAVLLACSIYEAVYGMFAVQAVYASSYFEDFAVAFLIFITFIFISELKYWRINYPQIIISLGLIIITLASIAEKHTALRGDVELYADEEITQINSNGYELGGLHDTAPLPLSSLREGQIITLSTKEIFTIEKVLPHALYKLEVEGDENYPPALLLSFFNKKIGIKRDYWLASNASLAEISNTLHLPQTIAVLKDRDLEKPQLRIFITNLNQLYIFNPLDNLINKTFASNYTIKDFHYFSRAKVAAEKLTNDNEKANPAVNLILDFKDDTGAVFSETHTRFSFLPSIPSRHSLSHTNLAVFLELLPSLSDYPANINKIIFEYDKGEWFYTINTSKPQPLTQQIELPSGSLTVEKKYNGAKFSYNFVPSSYGEPAVLIKNSNTSYWITPQKGFMLQDHSIIQLKKHKLISESELTVLPNIKLSNDFASHYAVIKYAYPHCLDTNKDCTYNDYKVSPNHPFIFNNYKLLLSSCEKNGCNFLITKSIAIKYIYLGAAILLLGILLLKKRNT